MSASEVWFDAVARVAADVVGMKAVFAAATTSAVTVAKPIVVPMANDLSQLPAIVLGLGPGEITPGSWERQRHEVRGAIWRPREPVGEIYALLVGDLSALLDAFPPHAKGYNVEPSLQSLLLTGHDGVVPAEWPPRSDRWYLTLPFTVEVIVNRAAVYAAA